MGTSLFAQGLASASPECQRSVSFYNDYIKQNNIDEAAPLWREAFKSCPPGIRQSIYVDGIKIFRYYISKNQDNPQLQKSLVDSLLLMYDLRIEHFPKYAKTASTFKVYDMLDYVQDDNAILEAVNKAIDMAQQGCDPSLLVIAMQKINALYAKNEKSAEEVMTLYAHLTSIADSQIERGVPDIEKVKVDLDNLFVSSGIATCENLIELFTPRFRANPDDTELSTTIVSLLGSANCTNEPLFLECVESLYKSDSSNYLYIKNLYTLYSSQGDTENAVKMLIKAIESPQSDDAEDAKMLITLSNTYLQQGELRKTMEAARRAMEKDQAVAGRANFIIGLVWGSIKCTGNEVESRANYWVAVDHLQRARALDPSLADEANVHISNYSKYFPDKEEIFFFDFTEGSSYTVSCNGYRANTTVRIRR